MGRSRPPVPLVVAAVLVPAAVFAVTTWQVAAHGPLRPVDERLGAALEQHAPAPWFSGLLADLGNPTVAVPVLVLVMAYVLLRTRRWLPVLSCLPAMAAVPAVVAPLKAWVDRPGPHGGIGYYPSGHAATSAVAYGAAALLVLLALRARAQKGAEAQARAGARSGQRPAVPVVPAVVLPAVLLTVANGAGLMWHGYHWPLDVLASWCLGLLLLAGPALVCRAAAPAQPGRASCRDSEPPGRAL